MGLELVLGLASVKRKCQWYDVFQMRQCGRLFARFTRLLTILAKLVKFTLILYTIMILATIGTNNSARQIRRLFYFSAKHKYLKIFLNSILTLVRDYLKCYLKLDVLIVQVIYSPRTSF